MTINAYPLTWPAGWKRTDAAYRRRATFAKKVPNSSGFARHTELSIADGTNRVLEELSRLGLGREDVVISTNVQLRLDGLPRSDRGEPRDAGAAVYWESGTGAPRVMAIDQYDRVADNLAAIAATLEAMRAIERHGGAAILERAFTGFVALPAPGASAPRHWRDVLGVPNTVQTEQTLKDAYRRAASSAHTDKPGGSHDAMVAVNLAYEQAKQELGYV